MRGAYIWRRIDDWEWTLRNAMRVYMRAIFQETACKRYIERYIYATQYPPFMVNQRVDLDIAGRNRIGNRFIVNRFNDNTRLFCCHSIDVIIFLMVKKKYIFVIERTLAVCTVPTQQMCRIQLVEAHVIPLETCPFVLARWKVIFVIKHLWLTAAVERIKKRAQSFLIKNELIILWANVRAHFSRGRQSPQLLGTLATLDERRT